MVIGDQERLLECILEELAHSLVKRERSSADRESDCLHWSYFWVAEPASVSVSQIAGLHQLQMIFDPGVSDYVRIFFGFQAIRPVPFDSENSLRCDLDWLV